MLVSVQTIVATTMTAKDETREVAEIGDQESFALSTMSRWLVPVTEYVPVHMPFSSPAATLIELPVFSAVTKTPSSKVPDAELPLVVSVPVKQEQDPTLELSGVRTMVLPLSDTA